jgi:hypothetical protein
VNPTCILEDGNETQFTVDIAEKVHPGSCDLAGVAAGDRRLPANIRGLMTAPQSSRRELQKHLKGSLA